MKLATNNDEADGFAQGLGTAFDAVYATQSRAGSTTQTSIFMLPDGMRGSNDLFNQKRNDTACTKELAFDLVIVAEPLKTSQLHSLLRSEFLDSKNSAQPETQMSDGGVQSYANDGDSQWLSVAEYAEEHFYDLALEQNKAIFVCVQVMIQGTKKSFNEKRSDDEAVDKLRQALATTVLSSPRQGSRSSRSPPRRKYA